MRLRVVIPVLAVGAIAVLSALLLLTGSGKAKRGAQPETGVSEGSDPAPAATDTLAAEPPAKAAPPREASSADAAPPETTTQHQAYVANRSSELEDLGMEDSPESLATILSELTNRDPEIRQAAVSAAKQFGSRDAIPRLMDAVNQTDDPEEKMALLDAVKFLQLPSLSELEVQAKTNSATASQ